MKKLETDGSDCSSRLERNEDHMTEESSTLTTGKKAKRLFIKVCVHSMEHWESVCADFLCHENKGIPQQHPQVHHCCRLEIRDGKMVDGSMMDRPKI
ncbi:hypothetical protein YC2023_119205 [Brassica napus]